MTPHLGWSWLNTENVPAGRQLVGGPGLHAATTLPFTSHHLPHLLPKLPEETVCLSLSLGHLRKCTVPSPWLWIYVCSFYPFCGRWRQHTVRSISLIHPSPQAVQKLGHDRVARLSLAFLSTSFCLTSSFQPLQSRGKTGERTNNEGAFTVYATIDLVWLQHNAD